MNQPVVIIGMGQLGGVMARGFLAAGYPVYPVVRKMDMGQAALHIPNPVFVLLAVPENVFHPVLQVIPEVWYDKMGFLQNELLPPDWADFRITSPTVMAIWFEKKKGTGVKVFRPTPVYGPGADTIGAAFEALDIPYRVLPDEAALLVELVKKNLYVLTINIAGLEVGGTVGELWSNHKELVRELADELLDIMERLTGAHLDREALLSDVVDAFGQVPDHKCRGRVAADRLARVLAHAGKAGLPAPTLNRIKRRL